MAFSPVRSGRSGLLVERPVRSCTPFRGVHRVSAVAKSADAGHRPKVDLAAGAKGLLLAALVAGGTALAAPAELMQHARADESVFERRRAELQQRRELLSKARATALESGTTGEEVSGSNAGPATAAASKVEAANAEVERSNQTRQSDFAGATERLRKSAAEYEKQASKSFKAPKAEESLPGPSWFSNFGGGSASAPDVKDVPVTPAPAPTPLPPPTALKSVPVIPAPPPSPPPPPPPLAVSPVAPARPTIEAPKTTAPKPEAPKLELPSMSAPQQQDAPPAAGGNWWDGIINADSLTQEAPRKPSAAEAVVKKVEPAKPQLELLEKKEAPGAALKQPAPQAPAPAKPTQAVTKPGKRRGPLPLWLVEIVVIAAVPGLLYALLRWETQVSAALGRAGELFIQTYNRVFPVARPREP